MACEVARGPAALEVEAAGHPVDVEHLAREMDPGRGPGLHAIPIQVAQVQPPGGHKLLLVLPAPAHGEDAGREVRPDGPREAQGRVIILSLLLSLLLLLLLVLL